MVLKTYLQIRACLGLAEQLAAQKTGSVLGLSIAAGSSTIDDISAFPYMCREIPKSVCVGKISERLPRRVLKSYEASPIDYILLPKSGRAGSLYSFLHPIP